MKGSWDKKKFLALFMAVAMVLASGIFVTTQSFKANEDGEVYEQGEAMEDEDVDFDDDDSDVDDDDADVDDDDDAEEIDVSDEDGDEIDEEVEPAETQAVKVKLNLNGVQAAAPNTVSVEVEDEVIDSEELPKLDNYTEGDTLYEFVGWSMDANAVAGEDDISVGDASEVEVFAVWETEPVEGEPAEQPEEAAENPEVTEEPAAETLTDEQPAEASAEEQTAETPADEQTGEAPAEEQAEEAAVVEEPETAEEEVKEETEAVEEEDEKSEEVAEEATEEVVEEEAAEETAEEQEQTEEEQSTEEQQDGELTAEQLAQMPANSFEAATASGVTVHASYDAGIFPEGVTMEVTDVSQEEALEAVGDAVENATEAVGVDITFRDKDGNEVQPYNGGTVNVSLSLSTPLFGEMQLVHVDGDGGASVIGDAEANGATFEADSFSIYVLTSSGSTATAEDREFDYKIAAKSELTLYENASSGEGENITYYGGEWAIAEGDQLLSFADGENTKPEAKKGEGNYQTIKVVSGETAGSAVVTYTYEVNGEQVKDSFNITIAGYKISFNLNGGTGTTPEDILLAASDSDVYVQMPSGDGLTREGYQFMGWTEEPERFETGIGSHDKWSNQTYSYYQPDDGNPATTDDMMNLPAGSAAEHTLYAVWSQTGEVRGTITVAIRNDGTLMTEPVTYGQEYQFLTGTHNKTGHNYWADTQQEEEKIEWYSDFDACTGNLGYYINYLDTNANLQRVTKSQLTSHVTERVNAVNEASGYQFWDPDHEYIVWYVVKNESDNHDWPQFHIDGCIRSYDKYYLNYDPNCNDYTGKAPASQETIKKNGEDAVDDKAVVTITDDNAAENRLARKGYDFAGWNTEKDGSGTGYTEGMEIELLQQTTTLYAMWTPKSNTQYKIRYFDADNDDELISEKTQSGITGGTATATDEDKRLAGYEFDESNTKNVVSGTIDADGKLVLKLYFRKVGQVVLTANTLEKVYDGNEAAGVIASAAGDGSDFQIDGNKVTFTHEGKTYTVEGAKVSVQQDGKEVTAKNAGSYDVVIDTASAVVKSASGKDTKMTVTGVNGRIVIAKRPVTVTSASHEWEYDGADHSDDGITSSSGDNEGWLEGDEPKWKVTGSIRLPGDTANTFATQLPNALEKLTNNYAVTLVEGTLKINSRATKYELKIEADSLEKLYDGNEYKIGKGGFDIVGVSETGNVSSTWQSIRDFFSQSESRTFKIGDNEYTITGISVSGSGKDAGIYETTADVSKAKITLGGKDMGDQFSIVSVPGQIVINKRCLTIHSATLQKEYDGDALENPQGDLEAKNSEYLVTAGHISGDGFADGEGASYAFTESQTAVGWKCNKFTYTLNEGTKATNYCINTCDGRLEVVNRNAKYEATVTTNEGSFTYDGEAHTVSGFVGQENDGKIPVTVSGKTYYVSGLSAEKSLTDAGSATVDVTGNLQVVDSNGNNVTDQFKINIEQKNITVTKRRVVLTSASLQKAYDGKALVNPGNTLETEETDGITITASGSGGGDGFVRGQGATISFTGSQTLVGASKNTFNYTLTGGAVAENYDVETVYGQLNVTSRDAKENTVTITTKGKETTYDGTPQTVNGFEDAEDGKIPVEVNGVKYVIDVTGVKAEVTATDVTEDEGIPNTANGTPRVLDEKGNDVTDQFTVVIDTKNLVIKPRKIELTSADKSKVYDGEALTNGETPLTIDGEGLISTDTLRVDFTGSQTYVGQSENSFTYELDKPKNYKVKTTFGTLLVTTSGNSGGGDGGEEPGEPEGPKTVDPSKVIGKTHEDKVYAIGETVDFTITARNIYDDARTLTIGEQEGVTLDQDVFADVEPGAEVSTTAHYTVTEADAIAGIFTNHATVTVSDGGNGEPGETWEATDDVIPETTRPALSVIKKSNKQGTAVKVGDTIHYQVSVINNGNVTITGITVTDELTDDTWTVDSLKAGETKDFKTSHVVTEADAKAGKVTNTAVAAGKDPNGNDVTSRDSGSNDGKGGNGGNNGGGNNGGDDNNGGDNNGGDDNNGGGGNNGGSDTVTDDVDQRFTLTIHYVDENGNPIAPDYTKGYNYGEGYYVTSPAVSGYTPEYTFVSSDENGMPSKDVEVTVRYLKNPTPEPTPNRATPTNPTNPTTTPDNGTTNRSTTTDSDDDDDDDDSSSGTSSGSTKSSRTTKNSGTTKKNNGSANTGNGNADNGNADNGNAGTPDAANTQEAADNGNATAASTGRRATGTGTPRATDRVEGGAVVTVDEEGHANLVSASDTETPLFNLGLGDHRCNVLRFLILLAAIVVVTLHTKKMRDYQSRLFELREKLEEEKDNR